MKIADFLSKPRSNLAPSVLMFPAIDREATIKRLGLDEKAEEQGHNELPATNSSELDSVEQEIVDEVLSELKTLSILILKIQ